MSRFARPLLLAGLLLGLAVATYPLVAQERVAAPAGPPPVPPAEAHRPLAIPDRIILTWQGDPATEQSVTWRTATGVTTPVAEIALATAGPEMVKQAKRVQAETTPLKSDLGEALYHSARFADLQPATRYAYRVGDGTNWSEWFHFRTASTRAEPFSFVYFGDAQTNLKSLWSRVIREAYTDAPRARFIVHAGDLVNVAFRDAEWGEWFGAGGWVNGMVPSVATPGNHEYPLDPQRGGRALARHWRPQFALPENGPEGLEETAYCLDYQGLRLISLNSNERQEEQVAWLEERLRDYPNRWTILTFHHPLYSAARGRDNAKLRNLWLPVIDKYRVDLVLTGHDHTSARSNMSTGMGARGAGGTVFVVSVSGPKMYNADREPWMERIAEDTQLFQVISIDGNRLRYQARTATGELYDAFDLEKQPGQLNRLVERREGRIPERVRVSMPK
jgi:3',5'-cyclic AMP phosphodiesterase CpdA